jgi:hypothetical protein
MNIKSRKIYRINQLFFAAIFLLVSKATFATITFHNYEITLPGSGNTTYIGTYYGDWPDIQAPGVNPLYPNGSPIWKGVYDGFTAEGAPTFFAANMADFSRPWTTNETLARDYASALASQKGVTGVTFWTGVSGSDRNGAIVLSGTTAQMVSYPFSETRLYAFATPYPINAAPVPEIDGKMLPQVALLLGSLYLLFVFGRRNAGRGEPSEPALAQAA